MTATSPDPDAAENLCGAAIQVTSISYRYCTKPRGHGPLISPQGARVDHAIPAAGLWWTEDANQGAR